MIGSGLLHLQISTWLAILYTFTQYKLKGDGATPAGIACVLRLQAQAMPAESVATPNTQYYCHKKLNFYVATLSS